jgi:phospholipid/cholesterol/gamma-HCH transport system substrate-binding protein
MSEQKVSNIKTGLFVLAGLFLLIFTLYMIGKNQNLFGSNFEVKARFRNVNGLISGNNIRFSGIQVGTVKDIRIIDDTTIEVEMLIDDKMKSFIHKNALASIGTEGLMGNKIVNILPMEGEAPAVQAGDVLAAQKGIDTDEMLQTLDKTNGNIADISAELKNTVHRINNSPALWDILNEKSLAVNMKASLEHISDASATADAMIRDLHTIVSDIKRGKGAAGTLLTDTAFASHLNEAMRGIDAASARTAEVADQLNHTVSDIRGDLGEGKGTVGALLNDPAMRAKLSVSLDNIQKGTDAFSQDMEALKHNFLLRGYFRKLEKQQKKQADSVANR